jgi:hypothetical protein
VHLTLAATKARASSIADRHHVNRRSDARDHHDDRAVDPHDVGRHDRTDDHDACQHDIGRGDPHDDDHHHDHHHHHHDDHHDHDHDDHDDDDCGRIAGHGRMTVNVTRSSSHRLDRRHPPM